ncbi:MAG: DUF2322 family protein [Mannheimia varigena]|nr:DUF2322 family protein [Mannheimia varigena]
MQFKDYLATFPAIDNLAGLNMVNAEGEVIHNIPAIEGKLGSLKLYNALFAKFNGKLTASAAEQGIEWFAEHVEDAKANVGKHPNIDLLFKVIDNDLSLDLVPVEK